MIAAALAACLLATPAPATRLGDCGRVGQGPARATMHQLRHSLLCLVNGARRNHGLPPLNYSRGLRRAAEGHSLDMVRRRYFAHSGFGRGDLAVRASKAGYGDFSVVGENIGWGPGRRWGSPYAMFERWMHSEGHRANILNPGYRDFGGGVSRGSPIGGGRGVATYTLDFGAR